MDHMRISVTKSSPVVLSQVMSQGSYGAIKPILQVHQMKLLQKITLMKNF